MMDHAASVRSVTSSGTALGLYQPPPAAVVTPRWRINGYRAVIVIWTATEWEALADRPHDAQFFPCGIWCALRLE